MRLEKVSAICFTLNKKYLMKTHFFFLIFFLGLNGYCQQFDFSTINATGKTLVLTDPDSASIYIKKGLEEAARTHVHDTIYSDLYKLYGLNNIMLGKFDSGILYLEKAAEYAKKYPDRKIICQINIAVAYTNKGELDTSMQKLYSILKTKLNDRHKSMVYIELSSVYTLKFNYEEAINNLNKAIKILEKEKKNVEIYILKQKLANIYRLQENYTFAIDLYQECLEGFKKNDYEKDYYYTQLNMGEALRQLGAIDDAKKATLIAIKGVKKFEDITALGAAYSTLGDIHAIEGLKEEAIIAYQKSIDYMMVTNSSYITRVGLIFINYLNKEKQYAKALQIINTVKDVEAYKNANIKDKMDFFQAIAHTYHGLGKYYEASEKYALALALKDSVIEIDRKKNIKEIEAKFQNKLQREKNLALKSKNKALVEKVTRHKVMMWGSVIISVLLILFITLLIRSMRLKNRLKDEKLNSVKRDMEIIEIKHINAMESMAIEKNALDEKQRELTSSALRMANEQNMINKIIEKCESNGFENLAEVKRELDKINQQNDYWKQFEMRFNTIHPNFEFRLKEKLPTITKGEVEFCILLKLNLTNKEIASLLQITHETVIKKKYRIKRKMDIEDDIEFEEFIINL